MYHNSNANFVNGITLNVRDKNELKPFYEDVLGLNIINETLTSIQYEVGQNNHVITLVELQNGREPLMSEAGLFHIAIKLPQISDLANLLIHLSEYDIPVNGGIQPASLSLIYVHLFLSKIQKVICLNFMLIKTKRNGRGKMI